MSFRKGFAILTIHLTNPAIMKTLLYLFVVLTSVNAISQDIATDSKGKGVFTYYQAKKYWLDFSSRDLTFTFATPEKNIAFVTGSSRKVDKRSNWFFQGSILNATDKINLRGFRPGGRIKVGRQSKVTKVHDKYDWFTFSFAANGFLTIDNFKHYDPETESVSPSQPITIGTEVTSTIFTPLKWLVFSINGSVSNGWNDNQLLNFKAIEDVTLDDNVVAFESFDGKYGELLEGRNKARFAFSMSMTASYFNFIPYTSVNCATFDSPDYYVGLYTGFLTGKINYHQFDELPSTFGVGVDFKVSSDSWQLPNIFIRGNFNLKEFD